MPSITIDFVKEIELYKKIKDYDSKIMWLAFHDNEVDNRINISMTWNLPEMIDRGLTFKIDDGEIKNDLEWYKSQLENNYLISNYPDYNPNSDDDEEDDEDKFTIPKNVKSDIYWETEYQFYILYAEKLIKKIKLYMCISDDVNINIYSSVTGKILISEKGNNRNDKLTEWEVEYKKVYRRLYMLDIKLDISAEKAIEVYDRFTQEDLQLFNKLYFSHELNKILLYGKYNILMSEFYGFMRDEGELRDNVKFEKRNGKNYLSNDFHTIVWDDDETHKIEGCD